MSVYLLDANVLIALTVSDHEHHHRVRSWVAGVESVAVCPVVEGALVRFLVRLGERAVVAQHILALLRAREDVEFWPDVLTYSDVDLDHVRGHRQVTDAYLASLAASRPEGRLATLDVGLASARPDVAVLLPES